MKNAIGILIVVALNLYVALGSMVILTILILPVRKHSVSFRLFVSSSITLSVSYSFQCKDLLPTWLDLLLGILFFLMEL